MKVRLSIVIVLLLIASSLKAQSQKKLLLGTVNKINFIDSFQVSLVNYTVILSVTIDGKKYKFLLDTGASNCLSKKTASKLNLSKSMDSISISGINNSVHKLPLHKVPKFQIGSTVFNDFHFLITDNFFYDLLNIDGIIGSNSFKNLILHFDIQNSQITISDKLSLIDLPKKDKKTKTKLSLSPYQLHPYINIKLNACNSLKHNVLFDTGSNTFYSISDQNFEEIKNSTKSKIISKTNNLNTHGIYGRSNKDKKQFLLEIPILKINNYSIENIIAQSFSHPISSIGTKIFCYGKVTLDYRKRFFYFSPYSQKESCTNANNNRYLLGVNFTWTNGAVKIISIWDNLKAQKAGLKIGMKVIKIGDLSIPKSPSPSIMKDIMNYNFNTEKLPIRVELENGKIKNFILT